MKQKNIIEVKSGSAFIIITSIFSTLLLACITQDILIYCVPTLIKHKIWVLDVDVEASLYTWCSSAALFLASVLLFLIGRASNYISLIRRCQWYLLSFIFLTLSIDESLSFHEKLSGPFKSLLHTSGIFYFAWVIPASLLCITGFLLYIPFLWDLKIKDRVLMILSAVIYLMGAIVLEMISGVYAEENGGVYTGTYRILTNMEEGVEGLGVSLFVYCLMKLAEQINIKIIIGTSETSRKRESD